MCAHKNSDHPARRFYAWAFRLGCGVAGLLAWGIMAQSVGAQPTKLSDVLPSAMPTFNPNAPEVLRDVLEMENCLKNTTISQELRALPPMNYVQAVERLQSFRHHGDDASWVCPEPSVAAPPQLVLSTSAKAFMQQALAPIGKMVPGHNVTATCMGLMTQEQAWMALAALESDECFTIESRLALAMLERESNLLNQDLLAFVAARATWMDGEGRSAQYRQLIERACLASDPALASAARLWREAVSAPKSADALLLANQIWTTLWVDRSNMRVGTALARTISSTGQDVFAREMNSDKTPEVKERLLGRLAAAISRAAFQLEDGVQMKWAIEAAERLERADREDKLYPRYNYAMQQYAGGNYDGASEEFGKVFFSCVPCDTAANAGCCMANCSLLKNDVVGALAAMEMTIKLYGERQRIMRKAKPMRADFSKRLGLGREQEVSRYIERHYQGRLERALAQKARLAATELAMH